MLDRKLQRIERQKKKVKNARKKDVKISKNKLNF